MAPKKAGQPERSSFRLTEDEISAYAVHGDGPGCGLSDPGEDGVAL